MGMTFENSLNRKEGEDYPITPRERIFSIDLESNSSLKQVIFSRKKYGEENGEEVLIEGNIGALKKISFVDGLILEVVGTKGVLRIDLTSEELLQSLSLHHQNLGD